MEIARRPTTGLLTVMGFALRRGGVAVWRMLFVTDNDRGIDFKADGSDGFVASELRGLNPMVPVVDSPPCQFDGRGCLRRECRILLDVASLYLVQIARPEPVDGPLFAKHLPLGKAKGERACRCTSAKKAEGGVRALAGGLLQLK
jgi:hypothetical protein